jgi:hypothetical protein
MPRAADKIRRLQDSLTQQRGYFSGCSMRKHGREAGDDLARVLKMVKVFVVLAPPQPGDKMAGPSW